jgi:hypothetical protein
MSDLEILDDKTLAKRWFLEGSTEAIARRLDRITNKKRAGHLKSFKGGNKRLFRLEDVREYEARAKHSTASLLFDVFTTDDRLELDPAVGTNMEWLVGREP